MVHQIKECWLPVVAEEAEEEGTVGHGQAGCVAGDSRQEVAVPRRRPPQAQVLVPSEGRQQAGQRHIAVAQEAVRNGRGL